MNSKFHVIIPARMSSTRLPGKMLADVCGLPLIIRVAKQAQKSQTISVTIATDDEKIFDVCKEYNLNVVMTSKNHQSGTDRLAEAVKILNLADDEIIVNVQGDEPLIEPELINQLANFIAIKNTPIATIAHSIHSNEDIFNPNIVKTILDNYDTALYFSRAPIPYYRDGYNKPDIQINDKLNTLRHIGIYAYKVGFLNIYATLEPCLLEQAEALEQLRAMYYGHKIAVMQTNNAPAAGVDTAEDLEKVRKIIAAQV